MSQSFKNRVRATQQIHECRQKEATSKCNDNCRKNTNVNRKIACIKQCEANVDAKRIERMETKQNEKKN